MIEKINYQLMLEKELEKIKQNKTKPSLLLHACCAPCSSYVLEYLCSFFDITLLYYNPNISPQSEYDLRAEEIIKISSKFESKIKYIISAYSPQDFLNIAKGLEHEPEGGIRCEKCYKLRLEQTVKIAKEKGFDYFTTTLSISPHKNAQKLNTIGKTLSEKYNIPYLFSDFKKKNGYKRSCQLSEIFGIYRQDYCGCVYSKAEAQNRKSN